MRCGADQGGVARADRRTGRPAHPEVSVRWLLVLATLAAGITAAAAQPGPRSDNATLRPIPDGPGKRVAELQGLDKVTARTQRLSAPIGQATRFGTLEITVGDCLVNTPDAPPESVAYLTI